MSIKTNALIYFLAFCSGFCIMGIELLGGRILAPFFGSSVHIWGSIITVFMLSLSFGYLLGGKLSTKNASLTKYGLIFLIASIMVVPITLFSQPIMEFIFTHIEDSRYGSLLASTALFFIPTVILGMISPYSVRLLVTDSDKSGQVAGRLYFVSTLGSALGTIITSFYFVLAFDVNTIISAFALTLGSLGLVAIVINTLANNKELAHA
ncbi:MULTISPECIES: fused MFS/spermidine synthase [Pseudoalteromonas]|jgi:predicted membrane-bound spermidine synthase|uniref:Fused MFS/spermidine synthase n=1 Tax=Pseudoalteromonas distincta TaxID=77608 RepID=A0ABT9GF60_9GAMM|nr:MULTISPECIES: fused MFS/spermidine synthase [Pseudoalteromonas]KAA1156052.1 glycosyl transferase [Pseudoalteromonas distincta]KHM45968.1 glycosyl transferase [Pseudoalteromonas elyakovii]KID36449.1 glycosyl transferase [Pseudoalteromonas distincta]MBB1296893.1 fused MFS/spermidine synthase [Pseudoalteromonas sp. SR41-7]MBB1305056.1 fused MFS/spermidine synthase [Pseudoalteromonas sp. SR43-5]|tara:strand:- start:16912 stop:17535 length:624 start_codon:yes stop_codon:yes gene_type:complete